MSDGASVVALLNEYDIQLPSEPIQHQDENEQDLFSFEVWVATVEEKDSLFSALKPFVDEYGELIDWHECTHDEAVSLPCVIAETYSGGE